ncbi:MAG: DUF1778 domain-containing protein [Acidobacteria bacterium]|nr:MAG: DUF1778 domain-containing protein [Acidobacteriota bacterium]
MARQQAVKARKYSRKLERLEARVTREQKRIIERAAELRGTSVTEFVVVSAQQAATKTIKDFETLSLRGEARKVFVNALLNPPAPHAAAKAAARRYKQRLGR